MKAEGILSLIGNTPLIKLPRLFKNLPLNVYAKLEMLNPGGSVKDRAALNMLMDAWKKKRIDQNTTIIESSSGNMGIGLAQVCACLGLKFICVVDVHSQLLNRQIIETFGGKVDLVTTPHPKSGFLGARMNRVQQLLQTIPNSFNCDQYRNPWHPQSHVQTLDEIIKELGKAPDFIFCATSTCGTLRGLSESIKEKKLHTKVIAIDAVGSVIFGDSPKKRLIPGHGASVIPPLYQQGLEDDFIHVSDIDCVKGCRLLMKKEGIFAGGSSGGIIMGILHYATKLPTGATCVMMLSDRGGRYINTVYSNDWVAENYGQSALKEVQEVVLEQLAS